MVTIEQTQLYWALVERGEITQVIDGLLSRWRNISEMHRLRPDELEDLAWAGYEETAWLPVRWEKPAFNSSTHYLEGPRFRLADREVVAEFDVTLIPRPDLEVFRGIPVTLVGAAPAQESERA